MKVTMFNFLYLGPYITFMYYNIKIYYCNYARMLKFNKYFSCIYAVSNKKLYVIMNVHIYHVYFAIMYKHITHIYNYCRYYI